MRHRAVAIGTVGVLIVAAACHDTTFNPADLPASGYTMVFNDEFDGTQLSDLWEDGPFLPAPEPGEIVVADGVLRLTNKAAAPAGTGDGEWANVQLTGQCDYFTPNTTNCPALSLLGFQEGYFEARIRYDQDPYIWPAFWMWSVADTQAWPDGYEQFCAEGNLVSEWDIMENSYANQAQSNLHRNTPVVDPATGLGRCGVYNSMHHIRADLPVPAHEWHTWGGHWQNDELCLYFDNQPAGCMEPFDSTAQPMFIILTAARQRQSFVDSQCATWGTPCPGVPDADVWMEIDYVRVWQRNASPPTTTTTEPPTTTTEPPTTTTTVPPTTTTTKPCRPRPNRPC